MNGDRGVKILRYALGYGASSLAFYFVLVHLKQPVIFFASLFLLVISITDTLRSKIPNLATLTLVFVGLGYNLIYGGLPGGVTAMTGLLTGLALLLVPYLMGGVGGGDIKALAALGSLLGPVAIFQVTLLTGLIGGVMALLHVILSRNATDRLRGWREKARRFASLDLTTSQKTERPADRLKYAYGPAIAFGYFAFVHWGGLI